MKKLILILIPIAVLAFLLGRFTSSSKSEPEAGKEAAAVRLHTCGMHPEVIQEGPGSCPICKMFLTPMETPEEDSAGAEPQLYTCGMHPEVIQEGPGSCPICKMFLTPMAEQPSASGAPIPEGERKILYWRAPMDPSFLSEEPGKSPMGMDLVPVYDDEVSTGNISIDAQVVQNIGVTTVPVTRGPFTKSLRTYGTLDWDETSLYQVNAKIAGWVERLHVNETGQAVRRGQPLLSIYSPELVASQEEYLAALRTAREFADSPVESVARGGEELVAAARRRLELWDISPAQIDALEETGDVQRTLTLYAPASGVVIHKNVIEGDHIMPGTDLLRVASIDRLWILASLYEQDIPLVKRGAEASITFDSLPGERFTALVDFLHPTVDGKRRTNEVRLILPNPGSRLKPGMYAAVSIDVPIAENGLAIPSDSVIRPSSERSLVFLDRGSGRFEGREVVLGPDGDDGMVLVRAGLLEGDIVVTSAQFLIDSESQLQAAVRKMLDRKKAEAKASGGDGHAP